LGETGSKEIELPLWVSLTIAMMALISGRPCFIKNIKNLMMPISN
jgi:hypothetical protein